MRDDLNNEADQEKKAADQEKKRQEKELKREQDHLKEQVRLYRQNIDRVFPRHKTLYRTMVVLTIMCAAAGVGLTVFINIAPRALLPAIAPLLRPPHNEEKEAAAEKAEKLRKQGGSDRAGEGPKSPEQLKAERDERNEKRETERLDQTYGVLCVVIALLFAGAGAGGSFCSGLLLRWRLKAIYAEAAKCRGLLLKLAGDLDRPTMTKEQLEETRKSLSGIREEYHEYVLPPGTASEGGKPSPPTAGPSSPASC